MESHWHPTAKSKDDEIIFDCLFQQSIGHISDAHINPAITVGAVVLGKKSLRMAAVYLVAQCLGAVMGYGLLKVGSIP